MHLKRWENVSFVVGMVRAIERRSCMVCPLSGGSSAYIIASTITRKTFHGHVKFNLMTTAATLTQIDIYNFVYKYNSICLYNHA